MNDCACQTVQYNFGKYVTLIFFKFKNTLSNTGHLYVLLYMINSTQLLMLWSSYNLLDYILFIHCHCFMTLFNMRHLCKHFMWFAFFKNKLLFRSINDMRKIWQVKSLANSLYTIRLWIAHCLFTCNASYPP